MSDTATPTRREMSKTVKKASANGEKAPPKGITEGRGLMASMTALNLGRLFESLVEPDRRMTDVDKRMAEHAMDTISSGAKTQNRPNYEHKGEAKPPMKKSHEKANPKKKPAGRSGIPQAMFSSLRGR